MEKANRFIKLFQPVRIGEMEIKNRIVMPAMGTRFASEEGYVTEQTKAYFRERSKGGVGLIIVEITMVDQGSRSMPGELFIAHDKFIPGLQELAHIIKENGARAAIQINHAGCHVNSMVAGMQAVSASAIADAMCETPRELSVYEIKEMVQTYARAAERAKKAGFDGVEIHAAHHYLISDFLSSTLNQRTDEYGGNLNNRARFLLEVIRAVREAVGLNYPVWCRLDGQVYGERGGITIDESTEFARLAEEAGAQAIHVSAFMDDLPNAYLAPATLVPGCFVPLASRIKQAVKVPVIAVGWINPSLAEKVLREEKADLVAMGRALIADPYLPNKVATGKLEEVQTCIRCQQCVNFIEKPYLVCSVNPAAGREQEYKLLPATKTKDVLVVGGGPAGMKAAITAATRGHKVTLCESRPRLGGALVVGAVLRQELEDLVESLHNQMKSLPIDIKLSTEVTPELIAEIKPQAVIAATGGLPIVPELPGVEGKNVISIKDIYGLIGDPRGKGNGSKRRFLLRLAGIFVRCCYKPSIIRWFLRRGVLFGKRVIIIGGQLPGIELGAVLSDMGRKVTVVEPSERTGEGLSPLIQVYYGGKITNGGGSILTGVKLERITGKGLVITRSDDVREELTGDTVVLALGATADSQLVDSLWGKVPELYSVGDCVEPQTVLEATDTGLRAALAI
jgi:2,4-dienoyl-CoA reductase-like NADH-dependent reductase (Old Yellow Enzyme family)/thioredoxin reductase